MRQTLLFLDGQSIEEITTYILDKKLKQKSNTNLFKQLFEFFSDYQTHTNLQIRELELQPLNSQFKLIIIHGNEQTSYSLLISNQ